MGKKGSYYTDYRLYRLVALVSHKLVIDNETVPNYTTQGGDRLN